jgi:hypothetical protein
VDGVEDTTARNAGPHEATEDSRVRRPVGGLDMKWRLTLDSPVAGGVTSNRNYGRSMGAESENMDTTAQGLELGMT